MQMGVVRDNTCPMIKRWEVRLDRRFVLRHECIDRIVSRSSHSHLMNSTSL